MLALPGNAATLGGGGIAASASPRETHRHSSATINPDNFRVPPPRLIVQQPVRATVQPGGVVLSAKNIDNAQQVVDLTSVISGC